MQLKRAIQNNNQTKSNKQNRQINYTSKQNKPNNDQLNNTKTKKASKTILKSINKHRNQQQTNIHQTT